MKKLILMAAVALMGLPAAAQMQEAFPSYIQVNGRAEKEITPDEFYLSIVINERDSKGKISVESQQRDMIAALKRLGVNVEKQLKVANLSSEFFKKNTSVATAKYQLQLGSSAEVAKVWQALDGLGISNVSILKVSHSKIDEYKEQVRVEAMQNAKQSAQTLAGAIGQNVGKCFYIYDSNNNVMPVLYDNMAVMRSAKAGYAEEAAADEPPRRPVWPRMPQRTSRSTSRRSSCSTTCRRNSCWSSSPAAYAKRMSREGRPLRRLRVSRTEVVALRVPDSRAERGGRPGVVADEARRVRKTAPDGADSEKLYYLCLLCPLKKEELWKNSFVSITSIMRLLPSCPMRTVSWFGRPNGPRPTPMRPIRSSGWGRLRGCAAGKSSTEAISRARSIPRGFAPSGR